MQKPSHVTTIIIAAALLVIFPLLAAIGAITAHFSLAATGGDGLGIFERMGLVQGVLLAWSVLAAAIVGGLIATLLREHAHA